MISKNTALVSFFCTAAGFNCGADKKPCDPSVPGTICTIVGTGENGYDRNADEKILPALKAKMSLPQDTLTASDGAIYILDWNNHRLRSLQDGMVSWVAGRGELGGTLDDPENGDFNHPTNIVFDETGTKIVMAAWHNSKIRVIDRTTGTVTDLAGDGKRAYFGDGGSALLSSLDLPASLAYNPEGNLVIMDQANQVLRYIDDDGSMQLLAGQCVVDAAIEEGGPGACAADEVPAKCPPGDNGESGKYVCGGDISFCSRPCTPGYNGDDILATEMRVAQPFSQSAFPAGRIVYDGDGNLIFADTANHLIRMIDTDGYVRRVAGTAPVDGLSQSGYSGDGGDAVDATLNFPVDVALSEDGTLYFTDVFNHCVRAIDTDGTIYTAVGVCGESGFSGDGGPPDAALLKRPFGIEWAAGRLLVSDTGNNVIRSVLME